MAERAQRDARAGVAQANGVSFTPMYAVGDYVYFWGLAPVHDGTRVVGLVAQKRRVTGPARATQSLRELTGEDVSMFIRNRDGAFWASAPGSPAPAAVRRDSGSAGISQVRPGVGRVIVAEAPVDETPWVAALETPIRSVRARARTTAMMLAIVSVVLVAVGAALSLGISRRVTRPLVALTRAAEEIAAGHYDRAAIGRTRDDEIGRLADSFAQMADEIAASRRELEQRIGDAQASADALERANRQLQEAIRDAELARHDAERASRAKSDFLAVMSHELRTPLNAIAGYAQLLELEVFGTITDAQRDALARIARSQAHLLGLINSVLSFAKIDAGQLQYVIADASIDEILAGVEPLVAPQVRAKELVFDYRPCDPQIFVRADAEKLQQVVLNLLTNAIKFTPSGGRITLECEADDGMAHIHVRDTGVGIPADRVHAVFEPFVQGDRALNRPHEGVGLGLAIARDLARGMGGTLRVESRLGEGSVFTVSIPRAPRRSETRGPSASQRTQAV
jgi:signal transduction histidine kinase